MTDFPSDLAAVARIDVIPLILEVVCRSTGLGFSAVARVTDERWIACAVRDEIAFGLKPGDELKVETTICHEVRGSGELVVIDHVDEDVSYCGHPTAALYGFQSYISVPIRLPDGRMFGTLCAIDPKPARLSAPETVGMFQLFADLIGQHVDAQERLARSELALSDERRAAELREQFIAVLGHDLRNPLAAIDASAQRLLTLPIGETALPIARRIERSAVRMAGLIDDVLDFTRGRLGGGIAVKKEPQADLERVLEQVVDELQAAAPDRLILSDFRLAVPVSCDSARVAQLLSNLVANALSHGDKAEPVEVAAVSDSGSLEISVANKGEPIPAEVRSHLFQPFSRSSANPGEKGLGLGLYIAAEIARAHGGTLDVISTAEETRFTFRMGQPASSKLGRTDASGAQEHVSGLDA